MVAVADAFDAMTSNRSYSRARPVQVALDELRRCAGAHFDPRMVAALVRAITHSGWHPAVTADDPRSATGGTGPADGARWTGGGTRSVAGGTRRADGDTRPADGGTSSVPGPAAPGARR